MIHCGIEGLNGGENRNLDADEDTDPKGNSDHRKGCPHFIEAEVSEGNVFKKVIECHAYEDRSFPSRMVKIRSAMAAPSWLWVTRRRVFP